MESLAEIYASHSGPGKFNDKNTVHSYLPTYEDLLAPYRTTATRVLEIGLFDGHSLRMWEEYFQNAEVHGIDCSDQPHDGMADLRPMIQSRLHHIHIFDATSEAEARANFGDTKYDVVIDDASHALEQQLVLTEVWGSRMRDGSVYIVEDLQDYQAIATFKELGFRIIDLRSVKGRYDDVLAVRGGLS